MKFTLVKKSRKGKVFSPAFFNGVFQTKKIIRNSLDKNQTLGCYFVKKERNLQKTLVS